MRPRNPERRFQSGFTLLELVVVLAILAVVTTMAFRSVDQVVDQRRYEANRQMFDDLERAVLGDEKTLGLVSDLGRLPKTVKQGDELVLQELWKQGTLPSYDVRTSIVDAQVSLPTGWRGPYLHLGFDADNIHDGWGNPMSSPANTPEVTTVNSTGYARLRNETDGAITAAEQPVSIIWHLGANGAYNELDKDLDRDRELSFVGRSQASVKASVDFSGNDGPKTINAGEKVTVRIFAPNPSDVSVLSAYSATTEAMVAAGSIGVPEQSASPNSIVGATIGLRAVRAYLYQSDGTTLIAQSAVKYVTLRPGVNFIPLTIYRP